MLIIFIEFISKTTFNSLKILYTLNNLMKNIKVEFLNQISVYSKLN